MRLPDCRFQGYHRWRAVGGTIFFALLGLGLLGTTAVIIKAVTSYTSHSVTIPLWCHACRAVDRHLIRSQH